LPLLLPLHAVGCGITGRQWGSLPPCMCGCRWLIVNLNVIITLVFQQVIILVYITGTCSAARCLRDDET
jgi:hypothetical protein